MRATAGAAAATKLGSWTQDEQSPSTYSEGFAFFNPGIISRVSLKE
jgi:hypothetical protein